MIEATDRRFREFTASSILLEALQRRLTAAAETARPHVLQTTVAVRAPVPKASILDHLDVAGRLTEAEYARQLEKPQAALTELAWAAREKNVSTVMVCEGWDAAGTGSAIRRVTPAMDPRLYRVVGIAAPNEEERAQHYLWRCWRHLPRAGFTTIFDRSWYSRVLVARVEKSARTDEWNRAYHEINAFEQQLVEHGVGVDKFWLHITPQEQLRRFKERLTVDPRRYKIIAEDWRNRKQWDDYTRAVDDLVVRCSTEYAPWTLVAANDQRFARVPILKTVVERLRAAL